MTTLVGIQNALCKASHSFSAAYDWSTVGLHGRKRVQYSCSGKAFRAHLEVRLSTNVFWAVQAGLLTPLTFAQHRLSPLAAFSYSVYFLHNGMQ